MDKSVELLKRLKDEKPQENGRLTVPGCNYPPRNEMLVYINLVIMWIKFVCMKFVLTEYKEFVIR